jgi:hypothetical protein
MERPGSEPPCVPTSTNRRLYAIYSQIPVDRCVTLHRRMTFLRRVLKNILNKLALIGRSPGRPRFVCSKSKRHKRSRITILCEF